MLSPGIVATASTVLGWIACLNGLIARSASMRWLMSLWSEARPGLPSPYLRGPWPSPRYPPAHILRRTSQLPIPSHIPSQCTTIP